MKELILRLTKKNEEGKQKIVGYQVQRDGEIYFLKELPELFYKDPKSMHYAPSLNSDIDEIIALMPEYSSCDSFNDKPIIDHDSFDIGIRIGEQIVFEGDVVQYQLGDDKPEIWRLWFINNRFAFIDNDISDVSFDPDDPISNHTISIDWDISLGSEETLKVVGNVYEG